MQDRYTDEQLVRLREAAEAIKKMYADGTLYDFFRGKVLFLEGEIAREAVAREKERAEAAAQADAKAEAQKAEADAKAEAQKAEDSAKAEAQKDENPPT